MLEVYVGLDAHSKSSRFLVQSADSTVVGQGEIPTTLEGLRALTLQHHLAPGTLVGLESGTMAFYVARLLRQLDLRPVVIDAHEVRVKAHRPRQKSDRRDAFEICDGLRRGLYRSIVHVPPAPIQILRETLSRRRHFVRLQTTEVNAVKHLLRSSGLRHLSRPLQWESAWTRLIEQAPDEILASRIRLHQAVWSAAHAQVEILEGSLIEQSVHFAEDMRRLQTTPGVGPIVALTAIAFFSDPDRFSSSKHAASYAGLVPTTNQSGDRDWHGHITKQGSAELRSMLCEAAHHARRKSHPLNPYFTSLCARRGYTMAVIAVAHRLCRMLYAMLRDQTDFDITKLGIEVGPFEVKIVRPYRRRRAALRA